jgi:glycine/D-amino acid oxidase-like deaminating enzyme
MAEKPRIVVLGAGIVGASIAWHLAARGAEVTVLDAVGPGGIATAASFAWVNASWGNPDFYVRLRMRSMAEWRRLAGQVPDLPVRWTGGLLWDLPPERLLAFAREQAALGYGVRMVDRAGIDRIEPRLASPPELAVHVADEGAVEPARGALALLRDAEAHGARLRAPAHVVELRQEAGRVVGVDTPDGYLAADEVVVAAGAGTAALLAGVGVALNIATPPGLLVHTRPHARLLQGVVLAPELHMRQTDEGRILIGSDFGGADPGDDAAATAAQLLQGARRMLDGGQDLELDRLTVGHRPTPADGLPVIGRPADQAGLYVAVMHSGITLAAAVGRLVAEELISGRRDPLLGPFGWRAGVAGTCPARASLPPPGAL